MAIPVTTPLSDIQAVNLMLSTIGESPVNTLDGTVVEAERAQQILRQEILEVQSHGWHFNTEIEFELQPDVNGEIRIPDQYLSIDASKYETINVTQRGTRLYNIDDKTYVFTKPLKCDIVLGLPFSDLPQHARQYIIVRAARKFCEQFLGGELQAAFTDRDEKDAWKMFQKVEARHADYNIFSTYSTMRVLNRRPYGRIIRN